MRLTLALLVTSLAVVIGCGKKPAAEAVPEAPKSGGSVNSLLGSAAAQPDAPAAPVAVSDNSVPASTQKEGELPDYNAISNAINAFLIKYHRPPRDIDELISTGFLKRLPPPPVGKKYVLNQRFSTLTVVDK